MCSRIARHGSGGALEVSRVPPAEVSSARGARILSTGKPSKTLHVSDDRGAVFPYYLRNYREVNMIRAVFSRQSIGFF